MSSSLGLNNLYSSPLSSTAPLSPRSNVRQNYLYSPTRFHEELPSHIAPTGYAAESDTPTTPGAAYKMPGTVISFIGGLDRTRDFVFKNAPGAPPPVSPEVLGPFGLWKGTRFGYILAAANDNSKRALNARGYVSPPPDVVEEEVKKYWNSLSPEQYKKIETQLQDLSEEQGYAPPTREQIEHYEEKKGPRDVSGTRPYRALSPAEIKKYGIRAGYDNSYNIEYNKEKI